MMTIQAVKECADNLRDELCARTDTAQEVKEVARVMFLVTSLLIDVKRIAEALEKLAARHGHQDPNV